MSGLSASLGGRLRELRLLEGPEEALAPQRPKAKDPKGPGIQNR